MQGKQNTIKIKVIGWFLLAALAVLLTGIISYNSYNELLNALENPSSQESKLRELGDILANISEAEAKIRAYALTRDPEQLTAYQQLVISIHQELDTIKAIEPVDEGFNVKVDSVSQLLDNQIAGIAGFIELKNTLTQLSFSSQALEEISNTTDSIPTLRTTTTTTTTLTTVEPLPAAEEDDKKRKNTRRQQKRRTQEIARELAKLEQEPQIQTETTVTTDTSFVQPDTVLENIQQILVDIGREESQYQELLAGKELQLIESSVVIINQIRELIGGLEKQELSQNIQQANNAKLIASRSTLTISIIIFVCLIFGILFTYLIFKDVRIGDYYNKQLIGAKNDAEQLAESKQQFLSNMSHEIRTPLNAIIGFTEQLTNTPLQPKQQEYLEAVHTSSQHLLHTVNDILDYSKMEAGKLKIDQIEFELEETLTEVVTALQLKAREKKLSLTLKMIPKLPLYLRGDPFRLKQVLFNLVSNGIKFTEKGYVKVQCKYSEVSGHAKVTLSVKDTGIGIPKQQRKKIFNDFKQIDLSSTRRYEGTGLGLAITKNLVEMQGGNISVKENGTQGSEFVVDLEYEISGDSQPAWPPQDSGRRASRAGHSKSKILEARKETGAPTILNNSRLLVVDDDHFNIQLIKAILEKSEAQVTYCSNGKEAMKQIEQQTFDLILTDIHMPEAGGVELSHFVRSLTDPEKNETPIIALTANVMKNDLSKYKQAGIDNFVLKPFQEAELYQKIREALPEIEVDENPVKVEFELEDFKKFSVGDDEALRPILEAFHDNLSQNLQSLTAHAEGNDMEGVAELAHKMISSFGHIHAIEPVDKLRQLETLIRGENSNIPLKNLVDEIEQFAQPVLERLEQEIKLLS